MSDRDTSRRAASARLRCDLLREGFTVAEIAREISATFDIRPRTAWRWALDWPQWRLVQEYQRANEGASVSVSRISEWESWPFGGSQPSTLSRLALAFGHHCGVADLVDSHDLAELQDAERMLLGQLGAVGEAMPPTASAAVADVATRLTKAGADPRRYCDSTVVEVLGAQLAVANSLDRRRGSTVAQPVAMGIARLVVQSMVRECRPSVRRPLLGLAAQTAEFVGWLYRDRSKSKLARRWYNAAMEYAQLAGSDDLQALVLIRKAQMAYDLRQAHRVRGFARCALALSGVGAAYRAEATLQAAKGRLMDGDRIDPNRVIDEARTIAPADDATLSLREATVWLEAGRPEDADQTYQAALSRGLAPRDMCFFEIRRAMALARSGHPETSANLATQGLMTACAIGSQRSADLAFEVNDALEPWSMTTEVSEFRASLRHTTRQRRR